MSANTGSKSSTTVRVLPTENRQRLLEPYMTTREKGTGLGLAIVGKIIEEHDGRIELLDAARCGKWRAWSDDAGNFAGCQRTPAGK